MQPDWKSTNISAHKLRGGGGWIKHVPLRVVLASLIEIGSYQYLIFK